MPRTGTTLIGQLLKTAGTAPDGSTDSAREHVRIYPEMHPLSTPSLFGLFREIREMLLWPGWRDVDAATVDVRMLELLRAVWRCARPLAGPPDEGYERFGLKQPNAELYAAEFRAALGSIEPLWLYCIRDPVAVYESNLRAMGQWGDEKPRDFADRFHRSLDAIATVPTEHRTILDIDALSADQEVRKKSLDELLQFVDVPATARTAGFIERWPSVNRRTADSPPAVEEDEIQARVERFAGLRLTREIMERSTSLT